MHHVVSTRYGRHDLRLLGVKPGATGHQARDLQLTMTLEGDFAPAFVKGDNTVLLPTRSMANTASVFLHDHLESGVEQLAAALAERLVEACPAASAARVAVLEYPWTRVADSHHTFTTNPSDRWTADATARRGRPTTVVSGISGLHRAVTTGSAFTGFLVDDYTLAEQVTKEDRILHLSGDMWWEYGSRPTDYDHCRSEALRAFMDSVTDQRSFSSQHSAYLSAAAVLDACPDIHRVGVRTRAHSHAPLDLSPFDRGDQGSVHLGTDSSYSSGEVTLTRGV
ncbi:hypothetical protein ACFY41_06065 [Streptomyces syringium]|uniref:hypothetical protein n=1 Tax=Streptomyces syringium TaxID=76729 RepID=UPI00367F797F